MWHNLRTKLKGWTQEEAADKLGVSRSTIAGYESKNRVPREDILKKLADEFKVTVDYLYIPDNVLYINSKKDNLSEDEVEFIVKNLEKYRNMKNNRINAT